MPEVVALTSRIVILGGGFGGVYTAVHLQRRFRRDPGVEITLIDRDNFFLMTPLLSGAASGTLEPPHAATPIRMLLPRARFIEADFESVDLGRRVVRARHAPAQRSYEVPYDQL